MMMDDDIVRQPDGTFVYDRRLEAMKMAQVSFNAFMDIYKPATRNYALMGDHAKLILKFLREGEYE